MESQTAQTISDVATLQAEATTLDASIATAQQRLKQLDADVQHEQHSRVSVSQLACTVEPLYMDI